MTILVESYADDWSHLWWCRLEGSARMLDEGAAVDHARELLTAKYSQYAAAPLDGPLIVVSIGALTGWAAST